MSILMRVGTDEKLYRFILPVYCSAVCPTFIFIFLRTSDPCIKLAIFPVITIVVHCRSFYFCAVL